MTAHGGQLSLMAIALGLPTTDGKSQHKLDTCRASLIAKVLHLVPVPQRYGQARHTTMGMSSECHQSVLHHSKCTYSMQHAYIYPVSLIQKLSAGTIFEH